MGYILIEESLFNRLIKQQLLDEDIFLNDFSEDYYWMTGNEVCDYLKISKALLNAYRNSHILFHCKVRETYRYKRAEVHKLKTEMDAELVESGKLIKCQLVDTEEQATKVLEKNISGPHFSSNKE